MIYKLAEVMDIIGGGTPKTNREEYWNGTIPWLSVRDFNDDQRYVYATEKSITELGLASSTTKLLDKDDIIISARGTVGELAMIPIPMAFNQSCYGLRAKKAVVEPVFLYYLLKYHIKSLKKNTHGSVFDTITRDTFSGIEVDIPTIEHQKQISEVLGSLDDKIELNNKINENLEQQLRTIFKAKFTDNPTLESMEKIPLSELCRVITKGTTPTTLSKPFVKSGINFIKAESILDNHSIDKSKFAFIDHDTNTLLKRSVIQAGDIVFTIAGTLGRFALIDKDVLPANTNQAVAIIRVDTKKILPEYIYTCLIGEWHHDYYSKRVQQAVQANLSLTTIKSLPVPVLSKEEMDKYMRLILPIVKAIKENEIQNGSLSVLRDTLLPRLMSGEIDVGNIQI